MHSRRRAPPRAPRRTPPHRRQARAAASTTNPTRADPHAGRPGRRPGAAACAADGAAGAAPLACVARPALAPDPSVRRRAPARAAAACGAAAASAYAPKHHTVLSTCQNQSLFASPFFSLLLSVIILRRSFHAATSKPHSVNLRINSHDASTQRRPWVPRGARRQRRCVLHAVAPAAPAQRAQKARPRRGRGRRDRTVLWPEDYATPAISCTGERAARQEVTTVLQIGSCIRADRYKQSSM